MMDRLKPLFFIIALQLSWVMASGVQGRDSDAMDFTKDSLETVQKNVSEGKAVLVDVRGLIEWNSGHIRKAILLEALISRDQTIEINCVSLSQNDVEDCVVSGRWYSFCVESGLGQISDSMLELEAIVS